MRRTALIAALALLMSVLVPTLVAPAPAAAEPTTHEVVVTDHAFTPAELHIDVGDTVVWEFRGATNHTVTADDGSFDSGQRVTGTFRWTFESGGFHPYACRIHGSMGMTGLVVVGHPPAADDLTGTVFVPSDGVLLHDAVTRAAPGTTVVLEPGVHELREPVAVRRPGVTVQGGERLKGSDAVGPVDPSQVVVTSPGAVPYAFVVTARGDRVATSKPVTTIADLTVTGFRLGGIRLEEAEGFALRRLRLTGRGWDHGVLARGSSRGTVEQVTSQGARYAGIAVQRCEPCNTSVRSSTVTGSFTGVELAGTAHGVEVADSTFRGNAAGIVAHTAASDEVHAVQGAVIHGNTVTSPSSDVPHPTVFQPENLPPGAGPGIWLAGARDAWVLGNAVTGHRYGVAVTARLGTSERVRVQDNVVDRSSKADLAWDGIGRDTCFAGNRTPDGGVPRSGPPDVQLLYPCNRSTVGVPDPVVHADLVLQAWQAYGEQALPRAP